MFKILRKNGGFTLIELMITVSLFLFVGVIVVWLGVVMCVCKGNYWYSDAQVLKELKVDHPAVTEVLKTKRHVFAKSVITVKENGVNRDYCLDSNVLQNYEFSDCGK